MPGQNCHHPCYDGAGIGLIITHLKRKFTCLLKFLNQQAIRGIRRWRMRVNSQFIRKIHIISRKLHAVMPINIFTQFKAE
jgi:hypothetical protein